MAIPPLVLKMLAQNSTRSAFNEIVSDSTKAGNAVEGASNKAKTALDKVKTSAAGVGPALKSAGDDGATGLSKIDGAAQNTESSLSRLGKAAAALYIEQGLRSMSNSITEVANNSVGASKKLDAMFTKRGEGGRIQELSGWASQLSKDAALVSDVPIKNAAAGLAGFGLKADQVKAIMPGLIGQSRLYNQSLEETAKAFGKSFASGNAGNLRRVGVTLSQGDLDYIKGASNETEKQQRIFERAKLSMDNYALSINEGMSDGEMASNRFANSINSVQVATGQGAASFKASWQGALTPILNDLAKNHQGFLAFVGGAIEAGNAVASIGAPIYSTAQMFMAFRNAQNLAKIAAAGEAEAVTAAGLASEEAGVLAGAAAIPFLALAGAAALALAGIGIAIYSYEKNKDKLNNATQSTTDARSSDQVADDQTKNQKVGAIENQAGNLTDRDRYVVLRKSTQAYLDLGETDSAEASSKQADELRKKLPKNFTEAQSPEAKKLIADLAALNAGANKGARFSQGDFQGYQSTSADADDAKAQAADLQKQIAAAKSGTGGVAPSGIPASGSGAPLGDDGGDDDASDAGAAPSGAPASFVAPSGLAPSANLTTSAASMGGPLGADSYANQIRQLQRAKRDAKGKENAAYREVLQHQIDSLQDSEHKLREAGKQARTAQRAADKTNSQAANDAADMQKLNIEGEYSSEINALEDQLRAAKELGDKAKIAALTTQIAVAKAAENRDKALADAATLADGAHKKSVEAQILKRYSLDERDAQREGQEAGRGAVGDSKTHDAFIRGAMIAKALQNGAGVGQMLSSFKPLNPAGSQAVTNSTPRVIELQMDMGHELTQRADGGITIRLKQAAQDIHLPYHGPADW